MKECINKDERQNAPFESLILVNPSFTTSTMSPMPSGISYYTLISLERMLPVPPLQSYWSWTWKHWMINALLRFDIIYFGKWFCIRALILPFAAMVLPLLTLKYCHWEIPALGFDVGGLDISCLTLTVINCFRCSMIPDIWCHHMEWEGRPGGHWVSNWSSFAAISLLVLWFYPQWTLVLCTNNVSLVLQMDVWLDFVFAFVLYDAVPWH